MLDVIFGLILIVFITLNAPKIFTILELFVKEFKTAHEEIEREGGGELVVYDPMKKK